MTTICKRCGFENPSARTYCKRCGVPLEQYTGGKREKAPRGGFGKNVQIGTRIYDGDDEFDDLVDGQAGDGDGEVFTTANPIHQRSRSIAYVSGRMMSEEDATLSQPQRVGQVLDEARPEGIAPPIGTADERRSPTPEPDCASPVVGASPHLTEPLAMGAIPAGQPEPRPTVPAAPVRPSAPRRSDTEPQQRPPGASFSELSPDAEEKRSTQHYQRGSSPAPAEQKAQERRAYYPRAVVSTPLPTRITEPSEPVIQTPQYETLPTVVSMPHTAPATLVFVDEQGRPADRLPLLPGRVIIGRTDGDVLFPNDPYLAPWHAQISFRKNGIFLKDMDTANSVYLRISGEIILHDEDRFIIGNQLFEFRSDWEEPKSQVDGSIIQGARGFRQGARIQLIREGGEPVGVYLISPELTIGRESGDLLFPDDPSLHKRHAGIKRFEDGTCHLIDLDSPTGVFLRIREEVELINGDCFQIGLQRILVEM